MKKIKISKEMGKLKEILVAKKKYFISGALILAILAVAIFLALRNKRPKDTEEKPLTLIEQYQMQLSDLEKKAESGNVNDLQAYGVALYATGNLSGAEEIYRKQIQADSNSFMAHNNLANTLRDEKKFEDAVDEYEKAINLSPKSTNSYINLASLYQYSLKDTDKALEVYDRAIENNPDMADLPNLAALASEQIGDFEKAQKYFEKALSVKEDNQTAKDGIARLKK